MNKSFLFFLLLQFCFAQSKWLKTFGADEIDGANHVLKVEEGFLILGYTTSFGNGGKDLWIIKIDNNRNKIWDKFYGGMHLDYGIKIIKAYDVGYIVLGQTHSFGNGSGDIWLLKIDDLGKIVWQKTYGGENLDIGYDICTSNEEGYVIVGTSVSRKTNSMDGYVFKVDSLGNLVWEQLYGGLNMDGFSSVTKKNEEYGYILFGHTKSYMLDKSRKKKKGFIGRIIASMFKKEPSSEAWIMDIDEYGDRNWHNTYGGKKEDVGKSIDAFSDNSFLLTCETESFGKGKKDIWLLKIDSNGKIIWENTFGGKKNDIFGSTLVYSNNSMFVTGQRAMKNKFSLRSILRINSKKNSPESVVYKSFIARLNGKGETIWENDVFEDQKCITRFMTLSGKNILIAGQKSTPFNGSGDAWVIAMNKKGEVIWDANFGGRGADGGNYALVTKDGGYLSVGYTDSYGYGKNDIWIIKTDFAGEKEWSKVYGGKLDDFGWGATESVDGGYVIIGETLSYGNGQSDIYIFKIDSIGNKVWSNTFGGISEDVGYSIVNSDDGGYVIASKTRSYGKGGNDGMIVKFDSLGTKEWNKVYGGKGLDYFKSIIKDSLNGYVVAGGTRSFNNGDSQGWVMNVDENGYPRWEKTYGDNGEDGFNMITRSKDNNFIAVGYSGSFFSKGMKDVLMVKIDPLGNKMWMNLYGGKSDDIANSVFECKDSGFAIAGETTSFGSGKNDILILKTNSNGVQKWKSTIGGKGVDIGRSIEELPKGGFIVSGTSTISNLSFDSILIKTDKKGKTSN